MRMLGLIGGMSWESTVLYYQHLNRLARARLGGLHSAKLLLFSVDFAEVAAHQHAGDWDSLTVMMVDAAQRLETAGATGLVICTNTMHKLAGAVEAEVTIPLLHVADAVAGRLQLADCKRPALLATKFTMEEDFYVGRLYDQHGIDMIVPDAADRDRVHRIIYEELCQGVINPASKAAMAEVMARLHDAGADSVVLGCTELGMLISADDTPLPLFDTTVIHAEAAMDFALLGAHGS